MFKTRRTKYFVSGIFWFDRPVNMSPIHVNTVHVILKAVIAGCGVGSKRWTVNLYLVIYAIYTEMKSGVIKL